MLYHMLSNLGQRITDRLVTAQQPGVLAGIPLHKAGQLLADSLEKTNNNTHGRALHVCAELGYFGRVRLTIVTVSYTHLTLPTIYSV